MKESQILYYYYNIGNEFKAGELESKNELKLLKFIKKLILEKVLHSIY